MDRSAKKAEQLKEELARLKKQTNNPPAYEVITSEESASGTKGKVTKSIVRKKKGKKEAAFKPIV